MTGFARDVGEAISDGLNAMHALQARLGISVAPPGSGLMSLREIAQAVAKFEGTLTALGGATSFKTSLVVDDQDGPQLQEIHRLVDDWERSGAIPVGLGDLTAAFLERWRRGWEPNK